MTLTDDRVRAFLSAARGNRYDVLFYLGLHGSMRKAELLGLNWADVDWASGPCPPTASATDTQAILTVVDPEGATARRLIGLSPIRLAKLRCQLERKGLARKLAVPRNRGFLGKENQHFIVLPVAVRLQNFAEFQRSEIR